jgi:lipopolysaccharide export system permease protein
MMENLDDFIDQDVAASKIIEYYIVFIPEIIRLILPVSVLLSALFTVGKMSNSNELTALKSSGMSLYRFMMPFIATSFFISIFSIYFGGFIVPKANKSKVHIEQTYMKKNVVYAGSNIFFQDDKNRIVSINYYNAVRGIANRVGIQEFDLNNIKKMLLRYDARTMVFDSTDNSWVLRSGIERKFSGPNIKIEKFDSLKLNFLNFTPDEVISKQQTPEEMSLNELEEFAEDQLRSGNDPTRIEIEYHSRIAFAFSSLVVVLFGLPLSASKRRGGLSIQFGLNILITFIYLVFMQISQAFGKNGVLDPLLTAWMANIIFLIGAIVNIIRVQK